MKSIAAYLVDYFRGINKLYLVATSLLVAALIILNYFFGLAGWLTVPTSLVSMIARYYVVFAGSFILTWALSWLVSREQPPTDGYFWLLLLASPLIFAYKVNIQTKLFISLDSKYLNTILQWPIKAVITVALSALMWVAGKNGKPFAGLSAKGFDARPYLLMVGLMIPLLVWAGHGADFQHVYPKLQMIGTQATIWQKVFFEFCYGLDFFTIELFFRGFIVLSFIKYGGSRAILPMAVFYCTIHFGKPLAECISSYFGGIILGVVVYRTRSIWGGLIVHLGIAWLMEVVGLIF